MGRISVQGGETFNQKVGILFYSILNLQTDRLQTLFEENYLCKNYWKSQSVLENYFWGNIPIIEKGENSTSFIRFLSEAVLVYQKRPDCRKPHTSKLYVGFSARQKISKFYSNIILFLCCDAKFGYIRTLWPMCVFIKLFVETKIRSNKLEVGKSDSKDCDIKQSQYWTVNVNIQ